MRATLLRFAHLVNVYCCLFRNTVHSEAMLGPANHLATAIADILDRHQMSARDLARATDISHSVFSRLHEQRIDAAGLTKLLKWSAGSDDADRILAAHLWDEIARTGYDPAAFWARITNGDTAWLLNLEPTLQGALQVLGESARADARLRMLLSSLADATLLQQAHAHDAKALRPKRKGKAKAPAAGAAPAPPVPIPAKAS